MLPVAQMEGAHLATTSYSFKAYYILKKNEKRMMKHACCSQRSRFALLFTSCCHKIKCN